MDIVFQLRNAEIVIDNTGIGKKIIHSACQSMRKEVSDVFFFYHYVEMRSEHRACDNPMERNDPVAVLLSLPKVIPQALRSAFRSFAISISKIVTGANLRSPVLALPALHRRGRCS